MQAMLRCAARDRGKSHWRGPAQLYRDWTAHFCGERTLIDELGKGDVLERDAERLEQREVAGRLAAGAAAADELAELMDVGPGEPAGGDQIAELAGLDLRLLQVIGDLHRGAQHRLGVELPAIAGI